MIQTGCVAIEPATGSVDVAVLDVAQDGQLLRLPLGIVLVDLADAGDLIWMQLPVIRILIEPRCRSGSTADGGADTRGYCSAKCLFDAFRQAICQRVDVLC